MTDTTTTEHQPAAAPRIEINAALVEQRIMTLAEIGRCEDTGVCRATFTPEWVEAQELLRTWFEAAGMTARYDPVGSLWGRYEGTEGGKVIASGSHVDSQLPGGRYDGALGIISALTAAETLYRQFGPPRRPLEVVSFCEEEGSAFGGARFWGSRAVTGRITAEDLTTIKATWGETIGDTMRRLGFRADEFASARRDDLDVFIELHIEQGPILESEGISVGVVNVINGSHGYTVTVTGQANHAGARPMDMRRDPMVGAAEMILAVNTNALAMGRPAVSTVGHITCIPNAGPIIPESVTFSIDCRHNDPAQLEALVQAHRDAVEEIAARRNLSVSYRERPMLAPCVCDPVVVSTLEQAAVRQGIPALTMPSGALHDTQRMSEVARVAMLFVQSRDGRSHTPAEFTSIPHAVDGIRVLADALYHLAWGG